LKKTTQFYFGFFLLFIDSEKMILSPFSDGVTTASQLSVTSSINMNTDVGDDLSSLLPHNLNVTVNQTKLKQTRISILIVTVLVTVLPLIVMVLVSLLTRRSYSSPLTTTYPWFQTSTIRMTVPLTQKIITTDKLPTKGKQFGDYIF
jgi:hypothetical protein